MEVYRELGCSDASDRMYGFDIDQQAFKSLAALGLTEQNDHFRRGDFLVSPVDGFRATAVLANPPYVHYHRVPKSRRKVLRQLRLHFSEAKLSGRASLWAYFVLHSMEFLERGGRMAFLLPRTLETADYSTALLAFLRTWFRDIRLVHVDERLFKSEGADEQVSILLAEGYGEAQGRGVLEQIQVADIEDLKSVLALTPKRSSPSQGPQECAQELLNGLNGVLQPLEDYATVRIGEVVGATKFFVRSLEDWQLLGVTKKYLKPLLTRSSQCSSLLLTKDVIADGGVPFLLLPPEDVQDKAIKRLLASWTLGARTTNSTFRKREVWYRCSYRTDFDAFLPSLNHVFVRVITNSAKISCGNGLYKLRVNHPGVAAWLPLVALSSPFRLAVEVHGRPRGGGALKLEPSDVRKLPLPAGHSWPPTQIQELTRQCEERLLHDDLDAATRLADEHLFVRSGLLTNEQLESVRDSLNRLMTKRLRKVAAKLNVARP